MKVRALALSLVPAAAAPVIAARYGPATRADRGGPAPFHAGSINHCPSCGASGWHVGRHVAECMGCGMPLAIVTPAMVTEP